MAYLFQRDNEVLFFKTNVRPSPELKQQLLWPALLYRIVAPRYFTTKLNIFQKAVLGMCNVQRMNEQEIADQLMLHQSLVKRILQELSKEGFIDRQRGVTDQGKNELMKIESAYERQTVQYLFQDPVSGKVWPRLVDKLNFSETEIADNGYPSIIVRRKGKREQTAGFVKIHPYVYLPPVHVLPPRPSNSEIFNAVIASFKASKNFNEANNTEEQDVVAKEAAEIDDDGNDAKVGWMRAEPSKISRINYMDTEPRPVFISTFIYVPQDEKLSPDGWQVADPFGLGANVWMKRWIEEATKKDQYLQEKIRRLYETGQEKLMNRRDSDYGQYYEFAQEELDKLLGIRVRDVPVYDNLVHIETEFQQIKFLREKASLLKRRDLMTSIRRMLEHLVLSIMAQNPVRESWRRVYYNSQPINDIRLLEQIYQGICAAIGLCPQIPFSFLKVESFYVRKASQQSGQVWRLRASILAALLSAVDYPNHPFRLAAKHKPDFLAMFESIVEEADEASHHNAQALSIADVDRSRRTAYILAAIFTGLDYESSLLDKTEGMESGEK